MRPCGGNRIVKIISVNEAGLRVGEDHPNSKLTNHEVDLIRYLRECGMSYSTLSEKFEISKGAVAKICRYERRNQFISRFKIMNDKTIC